MLLLAGAANAVEPTAIKAPAIGPAARWTAPVPGSARGPSGLAVVVLPEHALPLVHLMATVQAGAELDPPGQAGLAALTARFLRDGGAAGRDGPALNEAFDDLGGELEIEVDESGVRVYLTVLTTKLDRAIELFGDLLARPRLQPEAFADARTRHLAEIARKRDQPREVADQVFARVLFGAHPYGQPQLGSPASVGKLTVEDVRKFWSAHYGPRTTTLLVVGDTTLERAGKTAETAFEKWNSQATPAPPPPAARRSPPRVVLVDRPGAPQSELRVGYIGVDRGTPDFAAVWLLETVLGGSFTSRLNQNLREKHGYTYGAHADFKMFRGAGPFIARAAVRTDVTAESVKETLAELEGMRAPLSADELKKGRALVRQKIIEAFGDGTQTLFFLADLVLHGQPLDFWSRLPAALEKLDAKAVTAAAARVFLPEINIVVVGDRKVIEPKLRALPVAKSLEILPGLEP